MTKKNFKFDFLTKNKEIRIDILLHSKFGQISRTRLKKLIKEGFVKVNNIKIESPSKKIKFRDNVAIEFPPPKESRILPLKMPLDIIYDDKDLAIINKTPGVVIHPGAGNQNNTLINGLLYHYKNNLSSVGGKLRPGIVHRIDKDTSGLIVIAKNDFTHNELSKQFSDHTTQREYEALIWGSLRPLAGKICKNISRSKKNRQLMAVSITRGKKAITNYKTIEIYQNKNLPKISLVKCNLETGRTHQIRVHMAFKGNPVVGDRSYGKIKKHFKDIEPNIEKILSKFARQALHAKNLGFVHPGTARKVFFEAPRPHDFDMLIKSLKKYSL